MCRDELAKREKKKEEILTSDLINSLYIPKKWNGLFKLRKLLFHFSEIYHMLIDFCSLLFSKNFI